MKSYKGFDQNLRCRDYQYEIGKEYEEPKAVACERGFHACEMPLDVFYYYPPAESRYCEVEQAGKLSRGSDDSKVASTRIKIGGEIGIPGIVRAQIEYVKSHCTNECNVENGKQATAGEYGAATAGNRGAATAGNRGAATAGYAGAATAGNRGAATAGNRGAATAGEYGAATSRGSVTVGKNGVGTVRGTGVKIRGGMGAILLCAIESDESYDIACWAAAVVDGKTIKADTWYTVRDGKFVEVDE